jgi:hypothetical protein
MSARYLSASAGGRPPTHHVSAAISTHDDRSPTAIRRTLARWTACRAVLRAGRTPRRHWGGGADAASWWDWLRAALSPRWRTWIWSHDAATSATLLDLFGALDRGELAYQLPGSGRRRGRRGILAVDGHPFIAQLWTSGGASLCWVDTCNYWAADASALADASRPESDLLAHEQTADEGELRRRRDAAGIMAVVARTVREWADADMGRWCHTASGLSLESFRRLVADDRAPPVRGAKRWNILLDDRGGWSDIEREAYYGGLIEARYVGVVPAPDSAAAAHRVMHDAGPVGPVYHLDVSSLYPSVMRDMLAPVRRLRVYQRPTVRELAGMAASLGVVARVWIDDDAETYPVRIEGLLQQARGRYWTTLAGAELARAIERGSIVAVDEARTYSIAPVFRDWVDEMWGRRVDARARGDAVGESLAKMLLNGLAGKFAQRSRRWEDRPDSERRWRWGPWTVIDAESGAVHHYRAIAGITQRRTDQGDARHAFPAIAAWVTAAGRERMRQLASLCPPRTILYQAVDALFVTSAGRDALDAAGEIRAGEMGRLRVAGVAAEMEIVGHGCYRVGDRWVASGLWGGAWEDQAGVWVAHLWRRWDGLLAAPPDGSVMGLIVPAHRPRPRPKGSTDADGWVSPLQLELRDEWGRLSPRETVRRMAEFL